MTVKVTWKQALAWRLERHLLDPLTDASVEDVVRRLCGVQAQVASSAELAIRVRQSKSKSGEVARALSEGLLIKTWAMRGTLHLLTPDEAGGFLSLMAASRWWETPRWVRYFGVTPKQMEELRSIVSEVLADQSLTREELIAEVTRRPGFKHLGAALKSGWGTVLKPLAWQGDIVFGPSRGTRVTFMRPQIASKKWVAVPEPDAAWQAVILAYLGAHGPATIDNFSAWLSRGTISRRQLKSWFAELGELISEVEVEGELRYIPSEHVGALASTRPTSAVRLLSGFDQWVLGPGTDDPHVVPAAHRRAVSKQSGWIAPVVVVSGLVSGTWKLEGDRVEVAWFSDAVRPPTKPFGAEVARLSQIVGRDLTAVSQ